MFVTSPCFVTLVFDPNSSAELLAELGEPAAFEEVCDAADDFSQDVSVHGKQFWKRNLEVEFHTV